jgi:hypothetical protein
MDQHTPGPVSRGLQRHGIDVLTAQEAGRCHLADAEQLAFATSQQRVMVTFDSDYLALHLSGVQHAGIAWCPQRKYSIGQLIHALLLLHAIMDRASMQNQVEYL